ncbi:MAG TPA: isoprenylcysteine carboxylmethyltransferase family protein [Vicinamibacterales bacterium]
MASGISDQTSPDSTKLGGWLFRHRTAIPIPLALALFLLRVGRATFPWTLVFGGVVLTLGGEALRLAAVRRIGVISRTRSDRLGPLVMGGPFAYIRNPLYVGNVFIWTGFALTAGLPWLALLFGILLWLEYHAIVQWEENLLESRYGDDYNTYRAAVPRWLPRLGARHPAAPIPCQPVPGTGTAADGFSWRETLFSERGTLVAIAVGYFLLWLTARS